MKKIILYTASLVLTSVTNSVIAAGAPVGNIFSGGQAASANAVNQNFQELADRIDAIPGSTSYNYNNYIPTGNVTYTYSYNQIDTSSSFCYTQRRDTYVHTTQGSNSIIQRTEVPLDNSNTQCANSRIRTFTKGTSTFAVTKIEFYDTSNTLYRIFDITPGRIAMKSNMAEGNGWGATGSLTNTDILGASTTVNMEHQSRLFMGIEDVTVPYNGGTTYNNCLVILNNTNSTTSWQCPGVGLVKFSDTYGFYELANIQ